MTPGVRAQQLFGPGVLGEGNALLLQQAEAVAQRVQLLAVLVAPHVAQRLAPVERRARRVHLRNAWREPDQENEVMPHQHRRLMAMPPD